MPSAQPIREDAFGSSTTNLDYDVLIIGARLSGILSLYRMREHGLKTKVIEAGSGEGGTWFWNRYPGAHFDSEKHFSPQPETLRYIQYLTDKFDIRRNMQFNTRIRSAKLQEDSSSWLLEDEDSSHYICRYLITAIGILNKPTLPSIPSISNFKGQAWHTARQPNDACALNGKRVGIITISDKISPEEINKIRKRYPEIFHQCLKLYACFIHISDSRSEKLYAQPGFTMVLASFTPNKIHARVNDLEVTKNHGFGTRRVPLKSGYFKVFNQTNVRLVNIREDPISQITEPGVQTGEAFYELDVRIYATGFDAVTGSFNAVGIEGRNGTRLKDVWTDGIRTFLGLLVK
ncbi:hypothetical protein DER46DRAFT_628829 [Fusarium sp. MPI-SDFR-AT-0072]|nr:hypothetical protein DER46DRAFT_628829 [Fusarium sp. MPI-SDFR-AT-0072]